MSLQFYGVLYLLAGLALLAASIGFGRALIPFFRAGEIKTHDLAGLAGLSSAMIVSFMLGVFLCWAGVGNLVGR